MYSSWSFHVVVILGPLPPPLDWSRLGAIQIDFASVLIGLAALAYGTGVWRLGRQWSVRRTVAFFAGLAVTFVAIECVVGVYDDVLFYDHMIQHLLLIMVAAPLFAMGAPIELLERATGGRTHRLVTRARDSRVAGAIDHPLVALVLYAVVIPLCHLTSFYNLTLVDEQVHDAEHLLFLVVGYLFWRHVVAIEPSRHRLQPALRLCYLAAAVPVDTFTGLTLASANHELFPAYLQMHRTWGPSLLTDLHMGGDVMWVGGDVLMTLAMVPVTIQWVRDEDAKAAELDRLLDARDGPGGGDPDHGERVAAPAAERPPGSVSG